MNKSIGLKECSRKLEEWEEADTIMNELTDVGFERISDISVFMSVTV